SSTTLRITVPFDVPGGHQLSLHAANTINPGPSSFSGVGVSTTSDIVVAHPSSGSFTAPKAPGSVKLTPTTSAGDATGVRWTARLTTSVTGGLVANYGQVVLDAPAGAVFSPNGGDYAIRDVTNGNSSNSPGVSVIG